MTSAHPLKTGALSNSPGLPTSPLRIAKRDSPQPQLGPPGLAGLGSGRPGPAASPLARRQSSSYAHLRKNNLVSQSPFKAGPRRVSGERRVRPPLAPEQSEKERPMGARRRQVSGVQNLAQREYVSKSPFKRAPSAEHDEPPPPPVPPKHAVDVITKPLHERTQSLPVPMAPPAQRQPSASPHGTPTRSALVSRRLMGPRGTVRQRRKTVTFDERCDVVEFDRASCELDSLAFDSDTEVDYGRPDAYDAEESDQMQSDYELDYYEHPHDHPSDAPHHPGNDMDRPQDGNMFDSTANDSIVGLVDSMLQDNNSGASADVSMDTERPHTPSEKVPLVPDDAEDGVSYGRTHHAERAALAHEHHVPPLSPLVPPLAHREDSATPTNLSPAPDLRYLSDTLPESPGPRKAVGDRVAGFFNGLGGMVPKFGLDVARGEVNRPTDNPHAHPSHHTDPFAPNALDIPFIKQEDISPDISFTSDHSAGLDDTDLSALTGEGAENTSLTLSTLEAEIGRSDTPGARADEEVYETALEELHLPPTPSEIDAHEQSQSRSGSPMLSAMLAKLSAPFARPSSPSPARIASPFRGRSASPAGSLADLACSNEPLPPPPRIGSPAFGRRRSPAHPRAGSPLARSSTPPQPAPDSVQSSLSSTTGGRPSSLSSTGTGYGSASTRPTSYDSMGSRTGSPAVESPADSHTGRKSPRISREDVRERLERRSMESPLREFGQQELQPAQREPEVGEDNRTHSHLAVAGFAGERLSVMTTESSVDLRTATIEHAEKAVVRPAHVQAHSYDASASEAEERPKMPARAATIDSVPQDEQASRAGVPLEDMKSALEQFMDDVTSDAGSIVSGHREREGDFTPGAQRIRLEAVTQGITAGTFAVPVAPEERVDDAELEDDLRSEAEDGDEDDEAHAGEDADTSLEEARADREAEPEADVQDHAQPPQLAPIPSIAADLSAEDAPGPSSAAPAVLSPTSTSAPAVSKVSRRSREEAILEKRREVRRRDEDQRMGLTTPPRDARPLNTSIRRPKPRRSMSAGGAGGEEEGLLDVRGFTATQDPLAETIGRALRKLDGPTKAKYHVREHEETIYAADELGMSHSKKSGDLNMGKAWRPVKRPSDMNEYSQQIKAFRAQSENSKTHGKVFVRVVGARAMNLPFPSQPTAMTCTLNNGIHFVTTPECRLARDTNIGQEFELIEHSKLEFTLTLKVRRDPHIVAQLKANTPPPPPPVPEPVAPLPPPTSHRGGMRSFFKSSSPKKQQRALPPPTTRTPPPRSQWRLEENLARYLKADGTLARAFVSFKDIAARCDTRLFEIALPLVGQHAELGGKVSTLQVGELILELFRLPPLPVSAEELPQSLDECHRGLRHVAWHKVTYFEGILTQNGGDCVSWRRRHLRIIGSNLIAFNDVTKKPIATIDLKKAVTVEDDQQARRTLLSPESGSTGRSSSRYVDEFDGPNIERSFRLIFSGDEEIVFFADTEEEKTRWLEVFRALIGHIPPNPLWAELLWARQQGLAQQQAEARQAEPAHLQGPASSRPAIGHLRAQSAR